MGARLRCALVSALAGSGTGYESKKVDTLSARMEVLPVGAVALPMFKYSHGRGPDATMMYTFPEDKITQALVWPKDGTQMDLWVRTSNKGNRTQWVDQVVIRQDDVTVLNVTAPGTQMRVELDGKEVDWEGAGAAIPEVRFDSASDQTRVNLIQHNAPGVGANGGTCTCPDGQVYRVGDNTDNCETLACIGGIVGVCGEDNEGGEHVHVTCGPAEQIPGAVVTPALATIVAQNNQVEHFARGVGAWGGTCTCPDGQVYRVGDLLDDEGVGCASLACTGGIVGTCEKKNPGGEHKKVTCAPVDGVRGLAAAQALHSVEHDAPGVGAWGGSCTCPDGTAFQVGDMMDDEGKGCQGLACMGGVAGECQQDNAGGEHKRVTCAQGKSGSAAAQPTRSGGKEMVSKNKGVKFTMTKVKNHGGNDDFGGAQMLNLQAGGISMKVYSSAGKKAYGDQEGSKHVHLNFNFESAVPPDATGHFAELAGIRPMSPATRGLLASSSRMAFEAFETKMRMEQEARNAQQEAGAAGAEAGKELARGDVQVRRA